MDSVGLNTYSAFNISGKDMRYEKLQKRMQRKDYARKENDIYLKKFELLKKNIEDLKKQTVVAYSIAGAAVLCHVLFRGLNKIPYTDIDKIKKLAREMIEKFNLQSTGFRAVIADKKSESYVDVYGRPVDKLKNKMTRNAFYILPDNIAVAWKKSPIELFHEIGHAISGSKKDGYKHHSFMHWLPYYSPLPIGFCLVNTTEKDKKTPEKQKIYNMASVLKDNAYLMSMAMFLPLLTEEFNASRHAITFLKSSDKTLALKSLLLYVPAFGTYLVNAFAVSNLVKMFNTKSDNLYLQKSLFKQSKDYQNTLKFDKNISPKIAVIDEYKRRVVRVDWDKKPDMIHGEAVETFIRAGLPNADITRFDTNLDEVSVKRALDEILNSEQQYDAINLSKSSDIKIDDLSSLIGYKVTAKSLKQDKDIIKERFFASPYKEAQDIKAIIKKMELLASKGVKIYVSAGNKGKDYLNLYTLANNVNVIGATNKYGVTKAPFSCDNSLITRWSKGVFNINKIKDSTGNSGFDINEDGRADISFNDTTAKLKIPEHYVFGTSFAAPNALVRDFEKVLED